MNERAFFSLARHGALRLVENLSLEGCREMDDRALERMAQCFQGLKRGGRAKAKAQPQAGNSRLKRLSLSGEDKEKKFVTAFVLRMITVICTEEGAL